MKVTISQFAEKYSMKKSDARATLNFLARHGRAEAIPVMTGQRGRPMLEFKLPAKGALNIK